MLRLSKWHLRFLSLVVFVLAWDMLARRLDSLLFPTPLDTFTALSHLIVTSEFWSALWLSHQALLLGFGSAALVGILLGLVMGRYRTAEAALNPYLDILLVTPKSALIPIIILAFGLGLFARVLVVFMFAVVVIVVNTRAGLRTLDPSWSEMARAFGANERQLWGKVWLRGALPAVMTGLRLGLARALTGMVAVELLLVAVGVGRLILDFQGLFESPSVYATVIVIVIEAVAVLQLLQFTEQRLTPWVGQVVRE